MRHYELLFYFMEVRRIELGSGRKPPVCSLHPIFVRFRRRPWRLFLPNLRSIAARRLAQNAPPEHFAGFQPSLPRSALTSRSSPLLNWYKKNAPTLLVEAFYGGEEGRTPVREGKPGTSTGLVMRGGCREPVAA